MYINKKELYALSFVLPLLDSALIECESSQNNIFASGTVSVRESIEDAEKALVSIEDREVLRRAKIIAKKLSNENK